MTVHDRDATWFLAQLKPNSARIAESNLCRQGFRTFLPLEEITKRSGSKFVKREQPVFPGYIFVAFDIAKGRWGAINSTNGVTRLVSFGKSPTPVPLGIVAQLMLRCDASGKLIPPRMLKPGDLVRVTEGAFLGFVAEIESLAPDRRVWVLMDIMGGKTRVEVAPDQLRAV